MKKNFPKICVDRIKFLSNLKEIPRHVGPEALACISDVYDQHYSSERLVKALFEINKEKTVALQRKELMEKGISALMTPYMEKLKSL